MVISPDPEPDGLSVGAGHALGRLLSQENQISDLVAFLAALDPGPLWGALGLTVRHPRVSREETLCGSSGRADLIVKDEAGPVALLEIKVGAGQHGDQFERYDSWAKAQTPPARCYLIGLDSRPPDVPAGWTAGLTLPGLLRCWRDSENAYAAWLASSAAAVLEGWVAQVDAKIGRATSPIVADLASRHIAADLSSVGWLTEAGGMVSATRTNGGTAMVLAWLPFPGEPRERGAWLCADLRSMIRDRPEFPWVLRLGIEVEINDEDAAAQTRVTAHDLAAPMLGALQCSAFREALRQAGNADLAAALTPRRRTRDGLRIVPDDLALEAWRMNTLSTSETLKHPVLYHDNLGSAFRLASLIEVDVVDLGRHQIVRLLASALSHLDRNAGYQP